MKSDFALVSAILAAFIVFIHGEMFMKKGVPNAMIHGGILQGRVNLARDGRPFYAFYGVPYANPPKRFQV